MSSPPSCGASAPRQIDLLASPRSSWCTARRPSCQPSSSTTRRGLPTTSKKTMRPIVRTPWFFSRRQESSPSLELQSTSKDSAAITAVESGVGHSRRVIWSYDSSRTARGCINYLLHGRAPSSSAKRLANDSYYLIDSREAESSNKSEQESKRPWNINLLRPFYT